MANNSMESVLIAYNNDGGTDLHSYFESCADDAKQFCNDNGHSFTCVFPPDLTEQNVITPMSEHTICFIAAHGDKNGIYNNNDEEVISVHTTNYDFNNKVFYAVSCLCGNNLKSELKRIGLETFVGYDDCLYVIESDISFKDTAMEGLRSLLSGDSKLIAKQKMMAKYADCINKTADKRTKALLIHNKEHLCFE